MQTASPTVQTNTIIAKNNGKFQSSVSSTFTETAMKKLTPREEEALYLSLLRAIKKRNPNQVKRCREMGANLKKIYFHLPFTGVFDKSYNAKNVHEIVAHELERSPNNRRLLQIREILSAP